MLNILRSVAHNINTSKFFAGFVMIMLNIGSKYITIKLSKSQESYLRNTIARQLLIFFDHLDGNQRCFNLYRNDSCLCSFNGSFI